MQDYKKIQKNRDEEYPAEYKKSPEIKKQDWIELLKNKEIFYKENIEYVKRLYCFDNHAATGIQMGLKHGQHPTSFTSPIVQLSKRISVQLSLNPVFGDDNKQTWWRILFWGKKTDDNHFEWKLKPELAEAIECLYSEILQKEINDYADKSLIDVINKLNLKDDSTSFKYSEIPKEKSKSSYIKNTEIYIRDKRISLNAIEHANHKCELDNNHTTFLRKTDGLPYTEPHHLIPMAYSSEFEYSLDVEENIISLCSNCHNQLHYGEGSKELVSKLYNQRRHFLKNAGILIELNKLLSMY